MNDRTVIPQQVSEDAAEWFARLETERPSEARRREFVDWLTRSPVHIEEFLRVSALHRALSRELKAEPRWLADVLAEASSSPDNVVRMADVEPSASQSKRTAAPRRGRIFWAAAAIVLLAVGIGTVVGIRNLPPVGDRGEVFATEIGEQSRITLADGSGVQLNTDTELRVRMGDALRQVTLVRGEAIFDVENDQARPFRVASGTAMVEAIGTRFNVYRKLDKTVVTVVEGRVAVSPVIEAAPPQQQVQTAEEDNPDEPATTATRPAHDTTKYAVELEAGHKLTVTRDGTIADPAPADIERETSWTRRRMVFDADTLDTVAAEFNRYNRDQLRIADATLSDRRITGVFNIDDPEAFLALLTDLDDIRVERSGDGSREIRRAE